MKRKTPSLVWQFFDRIIENGRCFSVTCKLCDSDYKYFGNTTNLRVHLNHKHPIQWELIQNGNLANSTLRALKEDGFSQSRYDKRRKFSNQESQNVSYSHKRIQSDSHNEDTIPQFEIQTVEVSENSETDCESVKEDSINLMNHLTDGNEEWLEETFETYEPKQKKHKYVKIKKEAVTPPRSIFKIKDKTYKPKQQVVVGPCNDEYSVYGEYIANKLRKMDNKRTKSNVQQLISTVLWQAEYGMYDDPDVIKQVIINCFNMVTVVSINNEDVTEMGQNQTTDSPETKDNE